MIEFYERVVLKLILNDINNKSRLHILYNKIESKLRALATSNVTSETCAVMLYPMEETCLPKEALRMLQRNVSFLTEDSFKSRSVNLMVFIKKEVESG